MDMPTAPRGGKRPSHGGGSNRGHKFSRGGRGRARGGGANGNGMHTGVPRPRPTETPEDSEASRPETPSAGGSSHLSTTRFDSLKGSIDDRLLRAIPFEHMSVVQAATISDALQGYDVLAQAKTGTGKTVAFLLPVISRLLQTKRTSGRIYTLILSPTRELAMQIEKEAKMLLAHIPDIGVQFTVGGTNMSAEAKRLFGQRCDILVATPGRLLDHINNSNLGDKLSDLKILVLDEADRMLDMGFRNELEKIKSRLPDRRQKPRQSLLFSATYPKTVMEVADVMPNHKFINTIPPEEQNTHEHVPQEYDVVEQQDVLPSLLTHILLEQQQMPGQAKIMAFLPTARATQLAFEAITKVDEILKKRTQVWEIHSRKSQSARAKASEQFRQASDGILFSSDVAARGVDFPNVSLVIQAGLPMNSDQYIHRLGRTARAGAAGRGVLLLSTFEQVFLSQPAIKALRLAPLDAAKRARVQALQPSSQQSINYALTKVSDETKAQTYQAALGYYNSSLRLLRWDKPTLVATMNDYAFNGLGWKGPGTPPLLAQTVGKMSLKGVPGINVVRQLPGKEGGAPSRGGGGGGRGGGRGGRGGGRGGM
ncbi:DEAD-domain-containing protein [Jaminaea rosea]|uniref:ATP-dependent RNA helicase n=1 Tax=Jaminaea rosea TaxID=1569628 RepID=A0A316UTE5_9BASI|nr:DEAD-domain-containing protein [Jaminaea rosea]PWN28566.1 DEAD-domain-containing protein [Jaminaea rosea]